MAPRSCKSASSDTIDNSGFISIDSGGSLETPSLINTGSIVIGSGGALETIGQESLADYGALTNDGLLIVGGGAGDTSFDLGGGTLDIAPGTPFANVEIFGSISDGTIVLAGGTLTPSYSTIFDGMIFVGPLDVPAGGDVKIENGFTLLATGGGTPGTLDLTAGGMLDFLDNETLDNTVLLVGGSGTDEAIQESFQGTVTLTFGSHLAMTQTRGSLTLFGGAVFDNLGTMALSGGTLTESVPLFENAGTITLQGESFLVQSNASGPPASPDSNSGLLSIGAGSVFRTGAQSAGFANTGQITIAAGSTLDEQTSISLTALGSIANAGLLLFSGTLDLGGGTMDVKPGTSLADVAITGAVQNGTIFEDGGSLALAGATLSAIALLGPLAPGANAGVTVMNGLSVRSPAGAAPGTIDLTGGGEKIIVADNETLDNVVVRLDDTGNPNSLEETDNSQTLTLGGNAVVTQDTGFAELFGFTIPATVWSISAMSAWPAARSTRTFCRSPMPARWCWGAARISRSAMVMGSSIAARWC